MATSTALAGHAFEMTAAQAAGALGASVHGDGNVRLNGVSTDSRTVAKGNLFVALSGETFDGHDYVAKAAAAGAGAALVLASKVEPLKTTGIPLIAVEDDTLLALGKLGRSHRDRIRVPVVGITGSAGKSTAKEMVSAVLSWGGRTVLKTEGNLNNRIGVPLTVMSATPEHAYCVVEMGISFKGEMTELVKIARPDVRVLLNAGHSHLEFLGSPEGVAEEKAHIWDDADASQWMIWNADDDRVTKQANARRFDHKLSFGYSPIAEVRIKDVQATGSGERRVTMQLKGKPLAATLKVFGAHHVMNAAAAAAVGLALGIPHEEIAAGLESRFTPMPGRGDLRRLNGDVLLVDDSYNSNPTSAMAGLTALDEVKGDGRKRTLAALGDMLELGSTARTEHARVGSWAARAGIDRLYLFGPNAPAVEAGALQNETGATVALPPDAASLTPPEIARLAAQASGTGHRPWVKVFDTRAALADALLADLQPGDALLVKGSRGMKMDEVVATLLQKKGVGA